jgi:hypothetical protein
MKRFSWITMMAMVCTLYACLGSDQATHPDDEDEAVVQQESEALKINPCALVRCRAGTQCEVQDGHAVCVPTAPQAECTSDKECRLFSNYCNGCECLALSTSEPNPVCKGTPVACFVDPCLNQSASCIAGQCVLSGSVSF